MASAATLSPAESHALFDILTHHETYAEIEAFKQPGQISTYGPPFQDVSTKTTSPVLQTLLSKFALPLPGLRDVKKEFWKGGVDKMIDELAAAELSESYDKGVLGVRKTLATAISALLEYPARGCLDGVEKEKVDKGKEYDVDDPKDVLSAWQDCLQELVYGDLVDRLFDRAAETDKLEEHESLVQAMHEFIIVNLASLMHYTLVLSPEGPTLLRMIENVHRLLPYVVIRQTLKIGNVATMISGMMRIVLAKVSVASVTNWIGLSSGADEGMNLLQQIISQVLAWDKRELKKRAEKIEKSKDAPPKEVRDELKDWITRTREEHEECRRQSREQGMSIVAVIMALSSQSTELSEAQHAQALEYLSLQLGVRDRNEIIRVLCQRNPDLLTSAVREGVDAYTPMIRHVHQAVNLADTVWDFERFVTDMLKMSKPTGAKGEEKPASVEDFVDLLHRHQTSSHKFIYQVAKNGKEVTGWWRDYVHKAVAQFRRDDTPPETEAALSKTASTPGTIRKSLTGTFSKLPEEDQKAVRAELAAREKYLEDLHAASAARISSVIKRTRSTPFGPGAYLARWQDLMDSTIITPNTEKGKVRYGASKSVKEEGRKDVDGVKQGAPTAKIEELAKKDLSPGEKIPDPPAAYKTLEVFGERFRELLAG